MKAIDPGRLNCRVTIKRRVAGQDGTGQPVVTLETVASVWANIRHRSGAETIKSDKDTSIVQVSMLMRTRPDLDHGMEVHHGDTVYQIRAILPDTDSRSHMYVVCEVVRG